MQDSRQYIKILQESRLTELGEMRKGGKECTQKKI